MRPVNYDFVENLRIGSPPVPRIRELQGDVELTRGRDVDFRT